MKIPAVSGNGIRIEGLKAPVRLFSAPALMHVELTTRCPLRCPQCYTAELADTSAGTGTGIRTGVAPQHRDIDRKVLMKLIAEAAQMKVAYIALSGGEPLLYPFLTETVKYINECGMASTMATSGFGLTAETLGKLFDAGIGIIWISLNGSTEAIHNYSRDKFDDTVKAMTLLKESGRTFGINWVARKDNAPDFPNVVEMAAQYGARYINILLSKPGKGDDPGSYLDGSEYKCLVEYLKKPDTQNRYSNNSSKELTVSVENCYSYLKAIIGGKPSAGINAGCLAGRAMIAVDVEGRFRPCRHLPFPEEWPGISEYWFGSEMLQKLRATEEHIGEPCRSCRYLSSCRTCRKVCMSFQDGFYAGQKDCPNLD